jgi:2-aminoadipate transaminase
MAAVTPPQLARRMIGVESSPVRDLLRLTARPGMISFAGGLPAPECFDLPAWRTAFDTALTGASARRNLQYSQTEGSPELRQNVSARLTGRGLPTGADDLLITTGSQQALTLVSAGILDPGAVVVVERPTYLAALQCFALAGARIVTARSDDDGIDPESLRAVIHETNPTALYLTPTFGNPTGRTLPLARRREIAALSTQHGFWVIEDDPYSELRYEGSPLPAIASLPEASERCLYLSTFSKTGAPGLRLGWLRATAPLIRSLGVLKQASDLHTSTIDQAAAATYLATADLDAHVTRLCQTYRERRDAMLAAIADTLPTGSTWNRPEGGMFVWVQLPDGMDAANLLPAALEHEVAFVPGWPFFADTPDRATMRLSFTTHAPTEIAEGMHRLRAALA